MKRILLLTSVALCVLGVWLLASFFRMSRTPLPGDPHVAPGTVFEVDLDVDSGEFANVTERDQLDQIRDWLLHVALVAEETPAEQISEALFDLPPVRKDVLRPTAGLEFGVTRSAVVGDRVVMAVLPADEGQPREDLLAGIADKARKDLGGEPTWTSSGPDRLAARERRIEEAADRDRSEIYDEQAG